jgi:hypothetical protein
VGESMKNERISEVTTKYIESKDSKKCVAGYFLRGNEYYKEKISTGL